MNLIKNFRIRIILISFFIIMTVSLVSCSDTATEKTNVAENQSSANDVFKTATGNTNPKTDQNSSKSPSTNTQSIPDSACTNTSEEWPEWNRIFLTSPDGNTFLGITPDLKPNKKYKFSAKDIYWARKKGESWDIKRKPSFHWVMPKGKFPDTTFWLKYSSKFDIKLILNKPFNKWEDLFDAKIASGGVKEDDFGKRDNLNIDENWCFTGVDPSSWPSWQKPSTQQN